MVTATVLFVLAFGGGSVLTQRSCPPSPAASGWDESSTNRFQLYATTFKSTCSAVMTEGWMDLQGLRV
jgi:hypothetical protein